MTFLQAAAPLSEEVPKPEACPLPSVTRRILAASEASAAIRRGIIRAARDCELWGGDWPTDRGCENLLQVRAAEELHVALRQHGLGWVTLEEPVASVSGGGTRRRGRRFSGMSDQQRADLAIWSRAENIYAMVELKRAEDDRSWRADLEKLARLVATYGRQHGNHLRYGVLGVYISRPTGELVRLRGARLKALAAETAARFGLRHRTILDEAVHCYQGGEEDGWTCGAASVELRA
ncbi:hypothetical protein [uncultured Sphingomonas sp.]|uniref:hypothetical protein n=1 Tax=uncultured Sphingomonas sp. TaxID=158754 RepID=UPI0025CC26D7|nr:hypothetical protein [uncultured Sphingomonas sp.]